MNPAALSTSLYTSLRATCLAASLLLALSSTAGADDAQLAPANAHATMDHSKMDHSQMDHSQMDHSKMDHSKMDHSQMDHTAHAAPGLHDLHDMSGHDHSAHMKAMPPGVARSETTYAIPDVTLTDMNGRKVRLFDELDSNDPVLVNFIFTTCTAVCPISSSTFAQIQADLLKAGKPFRLISVSIDPEEDTPARLRDYASRYEASKDWHFLTGSLENIIAVQRSFDAYRGNKMNHPPLIFIRGNAEKPWVRFEGFVAPDTVVEEYDRLRSVTKVGAN